MVTKKTSGCLGGGAAMPRVAEEQQISSTPRTFTVNQTSIIVAAFRGGFEVQRVADSKTRQSRCPARVPLSQPVQQHADN
jgi:hypothetical protein